MKKLIYICFFNVLSLCLLGDPEPLTAQERKDIVYWFKLKTAVLDGDLKNINYYWNLCREKGIDPATSVQNAKTIETVKALEKLGVDVTKRYPLYPYGKSPFSETMLEMACLNGFSDIIAYLLEKDPKAIDRKDEWFGCPPLHMAIIGGSLNVENSDRYKIVQLLVKHGAAINALDRDGDTALMTAAYRADVDSFKIIIDAGASDTIKNHKGKTVDDLLRDLKKREDCVEDAERMEKILMEKRKQNPNKINNEACPAGINDNLNKNTTISPK